MFEKKREPLISRKRFLLRLFYASGLALLAIGMALLIGLIGYHYVEGMDWFDAFINSSMTLAGMGLVTPLQTTSGKVFASFYALFCGLVFITIIGVIFAPIIHRLMHQFHEKHDTHSKREK